MVEEPTSGGGSLPLVLRIVETREEKFWEGWGWAVVGVEERGVLPLVEGSCPAVMEEPEVVIVDGSERLLLEAMVSSLLLLFLMLGRVFLYACGYACARVCACVVCVCVCVCRWCGECVGLMFGQGLLLSAGFSWEEIPNGASCLTGDTCRDEMRWAQAP